MPLTIEAEGARNLGDLGGCVLADGRSTSWRTLYRSGALDGLTEAGRQELFAKRRVRLVIDLRWPFEVARAPDRLPAGVAYRWMPLLPVATPVSTGHREDYVAILTQRAPQLAQIARWLLRAEALPAVIHCAEGIDRTGVAVAVLLDALGAAHSDIEADYLRVAGSSDWKDAPGRESPVEGGPGPGERARGVDDIRSALQTLRRLHGGAALLRDGGLTGPELNQLADRVSGGPS